MLGLNYREQRGALISRADHAGFKPSTSPQAAGSWGGDRCEGGVSSHRAGSAEEGRQMYPNTHMLIDWEGGEDFSLLSSWFPDFTLLVSVDSILLPVESRGHIIGTLTSCL